MSMLKKQISNGMIDALILISLYLVFASFPFSLIFKDDLILSTTLSICLVFLYFVFMIIYIIKSKTIKIEKRIFNLKHTLLILPSIIITVSNYFYLLSTNCVFTFSNTTLLNIGFTFIIVIVEELLFRGVLFPELKNFKPLQRILISAGIFGICHINRFLSTFNPLDLIIILYTFGLGIVLGLLYEYGGSLLSVIIFHLLYNVFNQVLFNCFVIKDMNYPIYYLINCIIGLAVAIYLGLIYFFIFRKIDNKKTEMS